MPNFAQTPRNRVKRLPERARYDRQTVYAILDQALMCHVGIAVDGQPFVIPTIHTRRDDTLFLHGATTSRLLKHIGGGAPLCVAVTLLDGLVVARGVFHNSMNYRSVVLFGQGRLVTDADEKYAVLHALTDRLYPGRWAEARLPTRRELKATSIVAVPIESASAKMRSGPPKDDDEDYALDLWAGVLSLETKYHLADDPRLKPGVRAPRSFKHYNR